MREEQGWEGWVDIEEEHKADFAPSVLKVPPLSISEILSVISASTTTPKGPSKVSLVL